MDYGQDTEVETQEDTPAAEEYWYQVEEAV
jgi:hypothetical protein